MYTSLQLMGNNLVQPDETNSTSSSTWIGGLFCQTPTTTTPPYNRTSSGSALTVSTAAASQVDGRRDGNKQPAAYDAVMVPPPVMGAGSCNLSLFTDELGSGGAARRPATFFPLASGKAPAAASGELQASCPSTLPPEPCMEMDRRRSAYPKEFETLLTPPAASSHVSGSSSTDELTSMTTSNDEAVLDSSHLLRDAHPPAAGQTHTCVHSIVRDLERLQDDNAAAHHHSAAHEYSVCTSGSTSPTLFSETDRWMVDEMDDRDLERLADDGRGLTFCHEPRSPIIELPPLDLEDEDCASADSHEQDANEESGMPARSPTEFGRQAGQREEWMRHMGMLLWDQQRMVSSRTSKHMHSIGMKLYQEMELEKRGQQHCSGCMPYAEDYADLLRPENHQCAKVYEQHACEIRRDLHRTLPSHHLFASCGGKRGQEALFNVLMAYAALDPDVGYCQGMGYLTAVLLMHVGIESEEDAFTLLIYVMFGCGMRGLYLQGMDQFKVWVEYLGRLTTNKVPKLHQHLKGTCCVPQRIGVSPVMYAAPWFLTIFGASMPLDFVWGVMDVLLVERATPIIFKAALTLLEGCEAQLLQQQTLEDCMSVLNVELPDAQAAVGCVPTLTAALRVELPAELEDALRMEVEYGLLMRYASNVLSVATSGMQEAAEVATQWESERAHNQQQLERNRLKLAQLKARVKDWHQDNARLAALVRTPASPTFWPQHIPSPKKDSGSQEIHKHSLLAEPLPAPSKESPMSQVASEEALNSQWRLPIR